MSKPNFKKMNWLERLVYPLEHPKYKQIKGFLVAYNLKGDIIGKCAQGEIACQNNILYNRYQSALVKNDFIDIGVPEDLVDENLPYLFITDSLNFVIKKNVDSICSYIYKLNDTGFTYKQIAEFLKVTFEDAV